MGLGAAIPLLRDLSDRTLAIILAVGMLGVFVILATLIWTRWGQARPVSKCIALSLLAHFLLVVYAYSTHILFGPPGKWTGQTVMVRLSDAADYQEAAPAKHSDPEPWEQAGMEDVPLLEAPPLERLPTPTTEPQRAAVAVAPPKIPQPQPADIAIARPPTPPLPVPAAPPLLPEKPANPTPPDQVADTPRESAPDVEATAQANSFDGVPDEVTSPRPDTPRLTDLLPDNDASGDSTAAESASLPSNPLRDPGGAVATQPAEAGNPTELPAEPLPTPAPAANAGEQFTAAASGIPRRLGDGREVPEPLRARVAADRLQAAQPFGASPRTEAAVAAALQWLASVQSADGRWDADSLGAGRETRTLGHDRRGAGAQADTGISGLALLAFLGNGETHLEGKHRETVQHGLEFLLASQASDGSLAGNSEFFAAMYSHGIATLALSEAYA
ncbi:MAG TPA: hypothetical protein VFV87_11720, partial [Pirellulaceae bacterium]|nr:hypothetical protein [Pirellulaceae bacterium]